MNAHKSEVHGRIAALKQWIVAGSIGIFVALGLVAARATANVTSSSASTGSATTTTVQDDSSADDVTSSQSYSFGSTSNASSSSFGAANTQTGGS